MKLRHRVWAPVLMAVALAFLFAPACALAREYSITSVDIDATVTEDGTLRVSETRTFDFDGSFNGVYWKIPTGENSGNGKDVSLTVVAVGEGDASGLDEFTLSDDGARHTYELSEYRSFTKVKLYSPHEDVSASFTIVYELSGVATRWEDTGELYWKFVSDGWDVESKNVTCTLHLPVPGGESVAAGDNVRAWGHGPLDASVAFDGDDIVFSVPGVGTDEYAEMHVTFPAAWIAACEQTAGSPMGHILSEEQQWADEANAEREKVRALRNIGIFGSVGLALATLAAAVAFQLRYSRASRPEFQDAYFRDVPTPDHPAVLGALCNGGKAQPKELTATLMRLTDQGVVKLEKASVTRKTRRGEKTTKEYLVTKLKHPERAAGDEGEWSRAIDAAACDLLFAKVAAAGGKPGSEVFLSSFKALAKSDPRAYEDAWSAWTGIAEARYKDRFLEGAPSRAGKWALIVAGILDIAASLASFFLLLLVLDEELPLCLGIPVLLALSGIVCAVLGARMKPLNREGIEAKAKLEALRRWLKEFTRLKEAVPSDVVLWNRLLVMAVVLGVSKEVIRQLKVAAPEVVGDPDFMPCYCWCDAGYGYGGRAPSAAFTSGLGSAHDVSAAALAASSDSSGGGGGGGFSGGGGGGFGGGGGGGAF